ncbi:hypothetical protein BRYFOR_09158 [Marvinbryantia formatexigens DSM 14469]|uniref:Uncharacterized protein n=1 Tax=Marvinbryantia formatexigens DSM 14469 TaxID=478749 RepID=C6LKH1_9FIRM|nr:hypothetical protein BRYFOR_09158 [Marvinbryantia formatexigens DSM 14469]
MCVNERKTIYRNSLEEIICVKKEYYDIIVRRKRDLWRRTDELKRKSEKTTD